MLWSGRRLLLNLCARFSGPGTVTVGHLLATSLSDTRIPKALALAPAPAQVTGLHFRSSCNWKATGMWQSENQLSLSLAKLHAARASSQIQLGFS